MTIVDEHITPYVAGLFTLRGSSSAPWVMCMNFRKTYGRKQTINSICYSLNA